MRGAAALAFFLAAVLAVFPTVVRSDDCYSCCSMGECKAGTMCCGCPRLCYCCVENTICQGETGPCLNGDDWSAPAWALPATAAPSTAAPSIRGAQLRPLLLDSAGAGAEQQPAVIER